MLDSADSEALSDFYAKLLGWTKFHYDAEWIIVVSEDKEGVPLVFQQVDTYEKPTWPSEQGKQQQMVHLDFYVDNVEESVEYALSCGATVAKKQFNNIWRVMLDPAGHPFCILPNKAP